MNSVSISPFFNGILSPLDLLLNEGSIIFVQPLLEGEGIFFEIQGENFYFTFGVNKECVYARRNEFIVSVIPTDEIKKQRIFISLVWNMNEITLYVNLFSSSTKTIPIITPISLIKWCREQNLFKTDEYETEASFREKVFSCLVSIQDKINEYGAINPFWDISYNGNQIKERKPKKETDIHLLISLLLSDQMLMSGVELIPEYKTGIGSLDFMFLGKIKNNGISKLCVEFKNAHSQDLYHGLIKQLPAYMRNKECNCGGYCVLFYKGDWFDDPKQSFFELLDDLEKLRIESDDPLIKTGIRIIIYDLSNKKSASKD